MVTDGEREENFSHRVRGEVQSEHQPAREEQADRNPPRREPPGGGPGHERRHISSPGSTDGRQTGTGEGAPTEEQRFHGRRPLAKAGIGARAARCVMAPPPPRPTAGPHPAPPRRKAASPRNRRPQTPAAPATAETRRPPWSPP